MQFRYFLAVISSQRGLGQKFLWFYHTYRVAHKTFLTFPCVSTIHFSSLHPFPCILEKKLYELRRLYKHIVASLFILSARMKKKSFLAFLIVACHLLQVSPSERRRRAHAHYVDPSNSTENAQKKLN